jgi:hypothetical protein
MHEENGGQEIHKKSRKKSALQQNGVMIDKKTSKIERFEPTGICYGETLSEYLSDDATCAPPCAEMVVPTRFLNYYQYCKWKKERKSKDEEKKRQFVEPSAGIGDGQPSRLSRKQRATNRQLLSQWGNSESFKLTRDDAENKNSLLLKTRIRRFVVRKSPIHSWGLYASEDIPMGSCVAAYLGEKLRSPILALLREREWLQHYGLESSYLFKVSKEIYIDATMTGNTSRFLNHSCDPNLYANVVPEEKTKTLYLPIWRYSHQNSTEQDGVPMGPKVDCSELSEAFSDPLLSRIPVHLKEELQWQQVNITEEDKGIFFFAKRHIASGEELTYDYKFPREKADKLPCYCQAKNCHGTLN